MLFKNAQIATQNALQIGTDSFNPKPSFSWAFSEC